MTDKTVVRKILSALGFESMDREELIKALEESAPEQGDPQEGQEVELVASIFKMDDARRVVYGVVLEPGSPRERDAHGHWTTEEDIWEAMYHYGKLSFKAIGLQHMSIGEGARIIETAQAPVDFDVVGSDGGTHRIRKGTWYMGVYCPPELWEKVKSGEYTGFSIGAKATIVPDKEDPRLPG